MKNDNKLIIKILCLLFSVYAHPLQFDTSVTHLYSDSSGTSWDFDASVNHALMSRDAKLDLYFDFNTVYSNLSVINGQLLNVALEYTFSYKNFSIENLFAASQSDSISIKIEKQFYVSGLKFYGTGLSVPISSNLFTLSPFFYCCTMNSSYGDFYWFYGHPQLPFGFTVGASVDIENNSFVAGYGNGNLKIVSNDSLPLFNSQENFFYIIYGHSFGHSKFTAAPSLMYAFSDIELTGTLSKYNQKYIMFPYRYYNVDGHINLQLLFAGAQLKWNIAQFSIELTPGLLLGIHNTNKINTDWSYKKNLFFDGSEGDLQINNSYLQWKGLVVCNLGITYKTSPKNHAIKINADKQFFIPIGFFSETSIGSAEIGKNGSVIASFLFSGLNLGLSISL